MGLRPPRPWHDSLGRVTWRDIPLLRLAVFQAAACGHLLRACQRLLERNDGCQLPHSRVPTTLRCLQDVAQQDGLVAGVHEAHCTHLSDRMQN